MWHKLVYIIYNVSNETTSLSLGVNLSFCFSVQCVAGDMWGWWIFSWMCLYLWVCVRMCVTLSTWMWIEEGLQLTVSHHRHGVKPPVPGGTGLPSLHHWGFLFLHLKSKPGLGSQQSSTPSLSPLSLSPSLLHDWAESHTHTNSTHTHRRASPHFRAPPPYLCPCDIQYVSDIKTWTYADEMMGTTLQTQ